MNHYEAKQEAKRERFEELADKAREEAIARYKAVRAISDNIPLGQPILIGHHSERHHRADIKRIDNNMRKHVEAVKKSDYYEQRAASVGTGGISADDPEAVQKLKGELSDLERKQARYKAINAAHKAFQKNPASLDKSELGDGEKNTIRNYKPAYSWEPHPIAPFQFTNLSSNIRRIKKRIEDLSAIAKRAEETTEPREMWSSDGWKVVEDLGDNRVLFTFNAIPSPETRTLLKRNAFKWSPTRKAWVCFAHTGGWYRAKSVVSEMWKGIAS